MYITDRTPSTYLPTGCCLRKLTGGNHLARWGGGLLHEHIGPGDEATHESVDFVHRSAARSLEVVILQHGHRAGAGESS